MRTLGTVVALGLLAGLPAPLANAVGAADPGDQQCRSEWADLAQLHGENGNPAGPVDEITARWDDYDAQAEARSSSATAADCGPVIEVFAADWDALESFQYDLYAFDPRGDQRRAEADRRHYVDLNGRLPRDVRRAFVVLRKHTQPAVRDLRPALRDAPAIDHTNSDEVHAFLLEARRAKRHSVHEQKLKPAYRVINNAELDEE